MYVQKQRKNGSKFELSIMLHLLLNLKMDFFFFVFTLDDMHKYRPTFIKAGYMVKLFFLCTIVEKKG